MMGRLYNIVICLVTFIFVLSTTDSASPCEDGWSFVMGANKCVKAFYVKKSWGEAQFACEKENARLVTIRDDNTQQSILKNLSHNALYWIGLFDIVKEGQFQWVDGTKLGEGYKNWAKGQPDRYVEGQELVNEDCVHSYADGQWNDLSCCRKLEYICEKRGPGCKYMNGGCPKDCTEEVGDRWHVTCIGTCDKGYTFQNGDCYDIDECSVRNGGCDKYCQNKPGSFECSCSIDYSYNGTHCVLEGDILVG